MLVQGDNDPVLRHSISWRVVLVAAGLVLAGLLQPGSARADTAAAQQVVQRLNTTLLEIMQSAAQLGYRGRYEKLAPVLSESFALPTMAKIALGQSWAELTPEQQTQLTRLFSEMSIANFASRFDGFSGERFEIAGERAGPRNAIVVENRIVRPDKPPVHLDFVMRQEDQGWRVIDILLDAKFSELARQRAEFAAVWRNGGYAALSTLLQQKIEQLATES